MGIFSKSKAEEQIADLTSQLNESQEKVASLTESVELKEATIETLTNEKNELSEAHESLKEDFTKLEGSLEETQMELQDAQAAQTDFDKKVDEQAIDIAAAAGAEAVAVTESDVEEQKSFEDAYKEAKAVGGMALSNFLKENRATVAQKLNK